MTVARVRAPAPKRVVFDGQSMNLFPSPPFGTPMPEILMENYSSIPVPWEVVAIGDTGWVELEPTFETRTKPQARSRAGDIIILNGGQSDIYELDRSGAQAYADLTNYIDLCRDAGFETIIVTTPPDMGLGGASGLTSAQNRVDLQILRDLTIANAAGADEVVDLFVPPLDDATNTTYFFADLVHVTTAGATAMADLIEPALTPYIEA